MQDRGGRVECERTAHGDAAVSPMNELNVLGDGTSMMTETGPKIKP